MLTSSIEVYPNETTGLLAGRIGRRTFRGRQRTCLVLSAAQPVQTARRRWSEVNPKGNQAAYLRARGSIGALGFRLVGGYHSHPNWHTRLSKSDREWCKGEVEERRQMELFPFTNRWLEVIVRIDKHLYSKRQSRQISLWETPSTLEGLVKISDTTGYHVTLRGHYFDASTFERVPFRLFYAN